MNLGSSILLMQLAILVISTVAIWKVFSRAGKPGWAALIPIYNFYVILKIGNQPGWWVILLFVPLVNIVIVTMALISLAQRFGRGAGFGLGLTFLPFLFFPLLAFRD